jgi:hypothetical protein
MKLSKTSKAIVSENMGLVGKVIKDKVHGASSLGYIPTMTSFRSAVSDCVRRRIPTRAAAFPPMLTVLIWNGSAQHCSTPPGGRGLSTQPIRSF